MKATLSILQELTTIGDSLMWIVGPGEMVSENTSRGLQEPHVHGRYITIHADNWLFHIEPDLVAAIQFVETHGDLKSWYVRFCGQEDETLLRVYVPRQRMEPADAAPATGNPRFDRIRDKYQQTEGIESIRREVRSSASQ